MQIIESKTKYILIVKFLFVFSFVPESNMCCYIPRLVVGGILGEHPG